jgi:fatty acid amide hydrolase 2
LEISKSIKTKKISIKEVVQIHINHIKKINSKINAIAKDNFEESLKLATEYDEKLNQTKDLNLLFQEFPFFGVPFTIKESIKCKNLPNSAGLYSRRNKISKRDAEVVQNLKKSGGILLCVTNTSEITMWYTLFL